MPKHLRRDLDRLAESILTMGAVVERAVLEAMRSLVERRPEVAAEVLRGDDSIDAREIEIEEECLKILALHQPVAADLRFVVTALKVNNDLERIGDLAAHIAERAAFLTRESPLPDEIDLTPMVESVRRMLRESLDALVRRDSVVARRVLARDAEVDRMHRALFEPIYQLMRSDPVAVERAVHILSVSRNLERIADHAANIAEDVVFLVEGEIIRHRWAGGEAVRGDPQYPQDMEES